MDDKIYRGYALQAWKKDFSFPRRIWMNLTGQRPHLIKFRSRWGAVLRFWEW